MRSIHLRKRSGNTTATGSRPSSNFPSVRRGQKDQFAELATDRARDSGNPVARFIILLAPVVFDPVVDAIVTPDGIITLLSRPMDGTGNWRGPGRPRWHRAISFPDTGQRRS